MPTNRVNTRLIAALEWTVVDQWARHNEHNASQSQTNSPDTVYAPRINEQVGPDHRGRVADIRRPTPERTINILRELDSKNINILTAELPYTSDTLTQHFELTLATEAIDYLDTATEPFGTMTSYFNEWYDLRLGTHYQKPNLWPTTTHQYYK